MKRTPVVTIRTVRPDDATAIRSFICGLSLRSLYFRFFASAAPPSSALLRTLTAAAAADILVVTDEAGAVIGHGMTAPEPAAGEDQATVTASVGLVIADEWQQRGLGSALLIALAGRAAERGVGTLLLEVQPSNSVMLGLIERHWPGAPRASTPDAVVICAPIGGGQATESGVVPASLRLLPPRHHPTGAPSVHDRTAA